MKIAIISDIHANLEALAAVLNEIDSRQITKIICLGDIVGYGASPNECVNTIRERMIASIAGNHDKAVAGEIDIENFSESARSAVLWTRKELTKENLAYLKTLSFFLQDENVLYVHSSPDNPEKFRYLLHIGDAMESFRYLSSPLCFIGHTHRPTIFCEDLVTQHIVRGKKCIVNVGSVGQPRDGNWRACFAVFDTEEYVVEHVRLDYNVFESQKKIYDSDLPHKLADRLTMGI